GPPSGRARRHRRRTPARDHRLSHRPAESGGRRGHALHARPGQQPAGRRERRRRLHHPAGKSGPVRGR
ncbi:hypothetical protein LTR94_038383, partial [Friedmanniomyces endolithicus]